MPAIPHSTSDMSPRTSRCRFSATISGARTQGSRPGTAPALTG
jgi:hypothetical protein